MLNNVAELSINLFLQLIHASANGKKVFVVNLLAYCFYLKAFKPESTFGHEHTFGIFNLHIWLLMCALHHNARKKQKIRLTEVIGHVVPTISFLQHAHGGSDANLLLHESVFQAELN